MMNIPIILTLSRIPLVFCFFHSDLKVRLIALILAMISDGLDGFLARRWNQCTSLGAVLDPIADKIFVSVLIFIFWKEGCFEDLSSVLSILSRDLAIFLFGGCLLMTGKFFSYKPRALLTGKVMTFFQFIVLIAMTLKYPVPSGFFVVFWILGVFAFIELVLRQKREFLVESKSR